MITEVDRYHGVVLRQLLVAVDRPVEIGAVDVAGRVDAFSFGAGAFQIKHSAKRLPPWQFTYLPENVQELLVLAERFSPTWAMLVCGTDGVVGIPIDELIEIIETEPAGGISVRVSRTRNSMYRVRGPGGALSRARPRGVAAFVEQALAESQLGTQR